MGCEKRSWRRRRREINATGDGRLEGALTGRTIKMIVVRVETKLEQGNWNGVLCVGEGIFSGSGFYGQVKKKKLYHVNKKIKVKPSIIYRPARDLTL